MKHKILLLFAALSAVFLSCSRLGKDVTVSTNRLVFSGASDTLHFVVSCKLEDGWYFDADNLSYGIGIPSAQTDWYVVNPQGGGRGDTEVTITIFGDAAGRRGELRIYAGDPEKLYATIELVCE